MSALFKDVSQPMQAVAQSGLFARLFYTGGPPVPNLLQVDVAYVVHRCFAIERQLGATVLLIC